MKWYAHSLPDKPRDEWQSLEDHLKNVAEIGRRFAKEFGAGQWAYLAGLWHDVRKYLNVPQKRTGLLRAETDKLYLYRG